MKLLKVLGALALASFAFARKDYARAQKLQEDWAESVAQDGPPAEAANALYNLGNTQLAKKDYAAYTNLMSTFGLAGNFIHGEIVHAGHR